MYFSSNQYPSLAHLPVTERKRVVAFATKDQNPWIGRRFGMIIAVIAIGAVALGLLAPNLTKSKLLVIASATGALFYLYMLLEINGPIRRAVEVHVSQTGTGGQTGEKN